MQKIDGKHVSGILKDEIAKEVSQMKEKKVKIPHLAAILVGNDPGSETYVKYKTKDCDYVGFKSSVIRLEEYVSENQIIDKVHELNGDDEIDGFIVQLPLPEHISEANIIEAIYPNKDVDGFHPVNIGKMVIGLPSYTPATPLGILELLKYYQIETSGKNCVVVGRSNIVGRPISILMSQKGYPGNATVTVCHSRTKNLDSFLLNADIIITAMGNPEFLREDMVKEGAVVIDVGTTRVPSHETKSGWKLKGDVKFRDVAPKCSYITPVPGGVGPMTRVSLLKNTLLASQWRQGHITLE